MVSAIRFIQFGTPEVLNLQTLSEQSPGQGEVWLEQEAVGVNDAGILGSIWSGHRPGFRVRWSSPSNNGSSQSFPRRPHGSFDWLTFGSHLTGIWLPVMCVCKSGGDSLFPLGHSQYRIAVDHNQPMQRVMAR
jgi:hypothetical protein